MLTRTAAPPDYLPESYMDDWMKVVRRSNPFNRERIVNDGFTALTDIDTVMKERELSSRVKGPSIYLLTLGLEGDIPADQAESRFRLLENSLTIKEKRD
jgi:hypothetical protein